MRKLMIAVLVTAAGAGLLAQQRPQGKAACDPDNGGIKLPQGFCAQVVADNLGQTRHIAVSPRGDLYTVVAAAGGPFGAPSGPPQDAVIALRDQDGDGRFETVQKFGKGLNGTGIGWHDGYLYVASNTEVVRSRWTAARSSRAASPR